MFITEIHLNDYYLQFKQLRLTLKFYRSTLIFDCDYTPKKFGCAVVTVRDSSFFGDKVDEIQHIVCAYAF